MRSYLLALLMMSACLPQNSGLDSPEDDGWTLGGGGGGGIGPAPPTMALQDGGGIGGTVAVDGSTLLVVEPRDGFDVTVESTNPAFTLTPAAAPNGELDFLVSTKEEGETDVVVHSQNFLDRWLHLEAHRVASVEIQAVDEHPYASRGGDVAWHVSYTKAAIWPRAADGGGLVDVSMDLVATDAPGLAFSDWNELALPGVAGHYLVSVRLDSFGIRSFGVDVVATIDRIEADVTGTLAHPGDQADVCFHAMHGDREVYSAPEITATGGDTWGSNTGRNCARVTATEPGELRVEADALGRSGSIAFTITAP